MKKLKLFLISIMVWLMALPMISQVTQGDMGLYVIEAENTTSTVSADSHEWLVQSDLQNAVSYLQVLPDDGLNTGNSGFEVTAAATFEVDFETAGTHYFWFRGHSLGKSTSNSFHLGVSNGSDTARYVAIGLDGGINDWQWVRIENGGGSIVSYDVTSPGVHTIIFWIREAGCAVDKMIISMDPAFDPSNMVEAAGNYTEFEAENYSYTTAVDVYDWLVVDETVMDDMSGGSSLQASPADSIKNFGNSGFETSAPSASYYVNFETAGTYYFWARANALASYDKNSFHMGISNGIDTARYVRIDVDGGNDNWQWANQENGVGSVSYDVTTPGIYEVIVWAREIGILVDKIAVTQSENLKPWALTEIVGRATEIEAEDYAFTSEADTVYSWEVIGDTVRAEMSGDHAMQAFPADSVKNFGNNGYETLAPSVSYFVDFQNAGTYYFWARANALASYDKNSFHLGITNGVDTVTYTRIDIDGGNDNWQWVNQENGVGAVSYDVSTPGVHEVIFWVRETGTVIDKFLFTQDPDYLPWSSQLLDVDFEDGVLPFITQWGGEFGSISIKAATLQGDSAMAIMLDDTDPGVDAWSLGFASRFPYAWVEAGQLYKATMIMGAESERTILLEFKTKSDYMAGDEAMLETSWKETVTIPAEPATFEIYFTPGESGYFEILFMPGADVNDLLVDAIALEEYENQAPEVALEVSATEVDPGSAVTLTAVATDDIGIAEVEFFAGGVSIGVDADEPFEITYTVPEDATGTITFSAIATDEGDLTATDALDVTVNAVNVVNSSEKAIALYPNPATDHFTVEIPSPGIFTVYSVAGSMVLQGSVEFGTNIVDISELESGIYVILLSGDEYQERARLIKK